MSTRIYTEQLPSGGVSIEAILDAAVEAAEPQPGLRWLDIGCGAGDLLRIIRDRWQPESMAGVDPIRWLADDLPEVRFHEVAAEDAELEPADRVMLIEVIEHLESPWTALRAAARLVAANGRIVVSTPNIVTLRHRLDLALRGQLTSFRADNEPHLTPALPHVITRVLEQEGIRVDAPRYAAPDVIPLSGGRCWPESVRARYPQLLSVSTIVSGTARRGSV